MAFLDNSGDIILDAVLTDTGRMRLAKGDGSFKIVKFAFADDEIDYSLYRNANNVNGTHPSGSAYFDLEILQSPVLEAFTNNTATLRSKLLSIPQTNLLYLPVLKLNNNQATWKAFGVECVGDPSVCTDDGYYVITTTQATQDTVDALPANGGVLDGVSGTGNEIVIDQGLDTTEISPTQGIGDLQENHYIVEMDHRLGHLVNSNGSPIDTQFVDDDQVASYHLSLGSTPSGILSVINTKEKSDVASTQSPGTAGGASSIYGPRGTRLKLKVGASTELQLSDFLFDRFGRQVTSADSSGDDTTLETLGYSTANTEKYIDSTIRVTGATTGYRIDIPIRYIKCTTCTTT